ncbi:MAG: hypothetical protein OXT09_24690 [Myxococcales bacterium]|nr:hypothetical protein [Myxococcales bacterium]
MQLLENCLGEGLGAALTGQMGPCLSFTRRVERFLRTSPGQVPIVRTTILSVALPCQLIAYNQQPDPKLLTSIEAHVQALEAVSLPAAAGHAVLYRACLEAAQGQVDRARLGWLRTAELLPEHLDGICAERQAIAEDRGARAAAQRREIDDALRALGVHDPAAFASARVPRGARGR